MVSLLHFTVQFAFVSLHPSVPGGECCSAGAALLSRKHYHT